MTGPPLHDIVIAQLHEAPEKFSDHATKIQILCEEIMVLRQTLRAVAELHRDVHYCGDPCPTLAIIDATLGG